MLILAVHTPQPSSITVQPVGSPYLLHRATPCSDITKQELWSVLGDTSTSSVQAAASQWLSASGSVPIFKGTGNGHAWAQMSGVELIIQPGHHREGGSSYPNPDASTKSQSGRVSVVSKPQCLLKMCTSLIPFSSSLWGWIQSPPRSQGKLLCCLPAQVRHILDVITNTLVPSVLPFLPKILWGCFDAINCHTTPATSQPQALTRQLLLHTWTPCTPSPAAPKLIHVTGSNISSLKLHPKFSLLPWKDLGLCWCYMG